MSFQLERHPLRVILCCGENGKLSIRYTGGVVDICIFVLCSNGHVFHFVVCGRQGELINGRYMSFVDDGTVASRVMCWYSGSGSSSNAPTLSISSW